MAKQFKIKHGLVVDEGGANITGSIGIVSGSITLDGPIPLIYLKDSTLDTTHMLNSNNTELQVKGDQAIRFFANNTSSMYIANDGDIKIGQGTGGPYAKLEVVEDSFTDFRVRGNSDLYKFAQLSHYGDFAALKSNRGNLQLLAGDANYPGYLAMYTSGSVRIKIDEDGNVGIGTNTPAYPFVVKRTGSNVVASFEGDENTYLRIARTGTQSGEAQLRVANNGNLSITSDGNISLKTGGVSGTNRLYVRGSDGNVGIGTTSPQSKLTIGAQAGTIATLADFRGDSDNDFIQVARATTTDRGVKIFANGRINASSTHTSEAAYRFDNTSSNTTTTGDREFFQINGGWSPSSGTSTWAQTLLTPTINTTGTYAGTVRGIYYNPTVTSATGATHRAIETTAGDVIFNGGNVGIGTTAPSHKLHVSGTYDVVKIEGSGSANSSSLFEVHGNNGLLFAIDDDLSDSLFSVNTVAGLPVIEAFADNRVVMGAFNQNDLVISGSRVGIGTDTPATKLHISGAGHDATLLRIEGVTSYNTDYRGDGFTFTGNQDYTIKNGGNKVLNLHQNDIKLFTANTERMRVTSTGNVGIGTTSPSYMLDVVGAGGTDGVIRSRRMIATGGTAADPAITTDSTIAGLYEPTYGHLGIVSRGQEVIRLINDPSNNMLTLIGTTTGTARLQVKGYGTTSGSLALRVENSSAQEKLAVYDDGRVRLNGTEHTWNAGTSPLLGIKTTTGINRLIALTSNVNATPASSLLSSHTSLSGISAGYFQSAVGGGLNIATGGGAALMATAKAGNAAAYIQNRNTNASSGDAYGIVQHNYVQTSTLDSITGMFIRNYFVVGSNNVTTHTSIRIADVQANNITSITNRYGLKIDFDNTNTTNAYGIYQGSNTLDNLLAGSLTVGNGLTVTGSIVHDGDLTVSGIVTAQEFHTEFVSASIVYQSGSTKFGDTSDDTHSFTGSLEVTGSVTVFDGNQINFKSTNNTYTGYIKKNSYNGEIELGNSVAIGAYSNFRLKGANNHDRWIFGSVVSDQTINHLFSSDQYRDSSIYAGDQGFFGFYSYGATNPANVLGLFDRNGNDNHGVKLLYQSASVYSEGLVIDNEGKVGIGTTSPNYTLDVATNLGITFGATSFIRINKEGLGDIGLTAPKIYSGTETLGFQSNNGTTSFNFAYGSTSLMTMKSNGNVGIGTTSPGTKLHILGTAPVVKIEGDGVTSAYLNFETNEVERWNIGVPSGQSRLNFNNGTSDLVTVLQSGNVGIGTTTPAYKLDVSGSAHIDENLHIGNPSTLTLRQSTSALEVFASNQNQLLLKFAGNNNYMQLGAFSSNYGKISYKGQENLYLGASGQVGVGVLPTSTSHRFLVSGSANQWGVVSLRGMTDTLTPTSYYYGAGNAHNFTRPILTGNNISVFDGTAAISESGYRIGNNDGVLNIGHVKAGTTQDGTVFNISGSNVGIGTTVPLAKLHAKSGDSGVSSVDTGTSAIIESNTTNYLRFSNPDSALAGLAWTSPSDNFAAYLRWQYSSRVLEMGTAKTNSSITFSTGNADERMRITSAGNVGIGTTAAFTTGGTAKLTIAGGGPFSLGASNSDLMYIRRNAAGKYQWQTYNGGNSGEIHLQPYGGNVGIGTTSPGSKLTVAGNIEASGSALKATSATTDFIGLSLDSPIGGGSNVNFNFEVGDTGLSGLHPKNLVIKGSSGASDIAFSPSTSYPGLMMLDGSTGRVGIGTTTPSHKLEVDSASNTALFRVGGTSYGNRALRLENTNGSTSQPGGVAFEMLSGDFTSQFEAYHKTSTAGAGVAQFGTYDLNSRVVLYSGGSDQMLETGYYRLRVSGSEVLYANSSGNVGIGTTSPTTRLDVVASSTTNTDIAHFANSNQTAKVKVSLDSVGSSLISMLDADNNEEVRISTQGTSWLNAGNVGIGTTTPAEKLTIEGNISGSGNLVVAGAIEGASKSFNIPHPTQPGKKLIYGSLEGPEHGVYARGQVEGNVIELPEEWTGLVDDTTITVQLTSIGSHQNLYVSDIKDNKIFIKNGNTFSSKIKAFYFVQAMRKDIDKLQTVR